MEQEQVVVVGAGPVGLWTAAELALAGLSPLVVERAPRRSPHSKALTVHPRTVEVLAMRDAHQPFLDAGTPIPSGHFAGLPTRLDFRPLDTPFPFTLLIPQERTEELLERHAVGLGARVLREHTVTGVAQDADSVLVSVRGPDGEHRVRTAYLVGCDGAGSTVRTRAGIDFPGTDATVYGFLGDVVLDTPLPHGASWYSEHGGAMATPPLPDGRHRLVGAVAAQPDRPGTELTLAELRDKMSRIAGVDLGLRDPSWLSRFGNATRQAASYRRGRVLLAGDAAHMHFPTGGVGLNVGVQDAMNLGWKLAAVLTGRAEERLLDTYHAERHPVGAALLANTLAQTALMTAFSAEGRALRTLFDGLLREHPELSLDLARRLSALDVDYPAATPGAHPLTGTRTPDLRLSQDNHVFALLRAGRPVLLDLSGGALATATDQARALAVPTCSGVLAERDRPAWSAVRAALIRPDGHVWWAGDHADDPALDRAAGQALSTLTSGRTGAQITPARSA
ncbi:FAD-dependent monooxygenase [Goodfellowiella coeruleoviolacea]|uniref:2-polyprenyl-6-methoxyphenol hydroxylase n=1 Tax=Goodfellowiella coeruleoviolacea TaxID=334858 RepID=A0AAE3G9X5_9PSEU|nr:FAD-dependent monooxygenase [Goodfellowiella coeruleoviolacea]MCP2163584.1 2-polyprenyl-6-methoxyphenol hydroxylase [Goodfellowiella coeruleoviolacea]